MLNKKCYHMIFSFSKCILFWISVFGLHHLQMEIFGSSADLFFFFYSFSFENCSCWETKLNQNSEAELVHKISHNLQLNLMLVPLVSQRGWIVRYHIYVGVLWNNEVDVIFITFWFWDLLTSLWKSVFSSVLCFVKNLFVYSALINKTDGSDTA